MVFWSFLWYIFGHKCNQKYPSLFRCLIKVHPSLISPWRLPCFVNNIPVHRASISCFVLRYWEGHKKKFAPCSLSTHCSLSKRGILTHYLNKWTIAIFHWDSYIFIERREENMRTPLALGKPFNDKIQRIIYCNDKCWTNFGDFLY